MGLEELWSANTTDGASEKMKNLGFLFSIFKRNYLGPLTSSEVIFSELMVNVACGQVIKS